MSAVWHQNMALHDLSEQTKTTLISSLASSDCQTAIKVTQTGHQRTKEDSRICFGVVSKEDFRFPPFVGSVTLACSNPISDLNQRIQIKNLRYVHYYFLAFVISFACATNAGTTSQGRTGSADRLIDI